MFFILLVIVHVIVCLILILVILLQAGRGAGLSGFLGGGATQTFFGTRAGDFLTQATRVAAILFLVTCLGLGVVTARRSRSLLGGARVAPQIDLTEPVPPLESEPWPSEPGAQGEVPPGAAVETPVPPEGLPEEGVTPQTTGEETIETVFPDLDSGAKE